MTTCAPAFPVAEIASLLQAYLDDSGALNRPVDLAVGPCAYQDDLRAHYLLPMDTT